MAACGLTWQHKARSGSYGGTSGGADTPDLFDAAAEPMSARAGWLSRARETSGVPMLMVWLRCLSGQQERSMAVLKCAVGRRPGWRV
jgi:hypothetical protein